MINMINQKKGDEWFWFKMVMQENPKLTSSHGYTRSTAPYGYLLWEGKNPQKLDGPTFALQEPQGQKIYWKK